MPFLHTPAHTPQQRRRVTLKTRTWTWTCCGWRCGPACRASRAPCCPRCRRCCSWSAAPLPSPWKLDQPCDFCEATVFRLCGFKTNGGRAGEFGYSIRSSQPAWRVGDLNALTLNQIARNSRSPILHSLDVCHGVCDKTATGSLPRRAGGQGGDPVRGPSVQGGWRSRALTVSRT